METKKLDYAKIESFVETTGFDLMAFIDWIQSGQEIIFHANRGETKGSDEKEEIVIGRMRGTNKLNSTIQFEKEADPKINTSKPEQTKPTHMQRKLEDLPFKERFDDLSRAEVGDYVFANGVISKDPHAAKVLTGIIGWINPDPHAPVGKRALVITPETIQDIWAEDRYKFGCTDLDDGWQNTYKLLEQAKIKGKKLPAVEYCANYARRGVKAGEGFLAALNQQKAISPNEEVINQSLDKIGGDLWEDWVWSSSEKSSYNAWVVNANGGNVDWNDKNHYYNYVRCVVPI